MFDPKTINWKPIPTKKTLYVASYGKGKFVCNLLTEAPVVFNTISSHVIWCYDSDENKKTIKGKTLSYHLGGILDRNCTGDYTITRNDGSEPKIWSTETMAKWFAEKIMHRNLDNVSFEEGHHDEFRNDSYANIGNISLGFHIAPTSSEIGDEAKEDIPLWFTIKIPISDTEDHYEDYSWREQKEFIKRCKEVLGL